MMLNRRVFTSILLLATLATVAILIPGGHESRIYGQFVGAVQPPGYAAGATNASAPAVIGNALAVTNPASNFLLLVQGGPVYCNGALAEIGQSSIQLQASTTYLVVANCAQQVVYAKTAVTAPGTSPGNANIGIPSSLLFAIPGLEVPIATVVCNATACGNGGNGSITDNRPLAAFPGLGTPLNTVPFASLDTTNATDGHLIYCTTCAVASSPCTGASTGALAIRVNGAWRCQ